jgi:UDP-glucose 4-epimerase
VEQGDQGLTRANHGEDYNSNNTARLSLAGMRSLLLKLDFMVKISRGEHAETHE